MVQILIYQVRENNHNMEKLHLKMDPDSICAALMHDVLEDCDVTKKNLEDLFGNDVANIVDGVSKLGKLDITSRSDRDANNLQKMMLAMSKQSSSC